MKILHNPRCGKSRNCLAIFDQKNIDYQIIKYLENPLTKEEIIY
jgi:arsenate reductase